MEGPLSKWTNVMKGWQYRWFVLDENAGILSYYTSKEKMMRGSRRGCVRLKGAVIGIDDEDDSTFTITVDQKTFHFQARDYDERDKWICALEDTIVRHTETLNSPEAKHVASNAELDAKLAETDAYLQLLIDQVKALDERIDTCEDMSAREKYCVIKVTAEAMIESIKQSIVVMQITRQNAMVNNNAIGSDDNVSVTLVSATSEDTGLTAEELPSVNGSGASHKEIESSFSSSDEEDDEFYDADESHSMSSSPTKESKSPFKDEEKPDPNESQQITVIASKDDMFDELYDDMNEDDLESLDQHSNMITYLLSQVRIGMDLTKVTLPTFILERRSLLEMYADFFAHPDLFATIPDCKTPQDRMIQVVRWYLSAFHAGRRSSVAKKPYNPILGETFLCCWDLPNMQTTDEEAVPSDGPIPWGSRDNVCFIAEQVSHHPPISAFYAEHYNKRISLDGYIWTKSKFLGLSIGVHMIGQAVISDIDHDEEYIITFPNGYGRSILTVPWVELGGKVTVSCAKTGYTASVDFLTKPFYGGKKHQVKGTVFSPNDKKSPIMTITGEWNGVMWAQHASGRSEMFVDTKSMAIMKKKVKQVEQQTEFESRRLWQHVTYYLKDKNVEKATEHKHKLEQRQREEAKVRLETGAPVETKHFHEVGEHWVYDRPLTKRLGSEQDA